MKIESGIYRKPKNFSRCGCVCKCRIQIRINNKFTDFIDIEYTININNNIVKYSFGQFDTITKLPIFFEIM